MSISLNERELKEIRSIDRLFAFSAAKMSAGKCINKIMAEDFDYSANLKFQMDESGQEYLCLILEDERIMMHSIISFLNSNTEDLIEEMKINRGKDDPDGYIMPYPP